MKILETIVAICFFVIVLAVAAYLTLSVNGAPVESNTSEESDVLRAGAPISIEAVESESTATITPTLSFTATAEPQPTASATPTGTFTATSEPEPQMPTETQAPIANKPTQTEQLPNLEQDVPTATLEPTIEPATPEPPTAIPSTHTPEVICHDGLWHPMICGTPTDTPNNGDNP